MQTLLDPVNRKPGKKATKPRVIKSALPADDYLRSDPANEKAVAGAIKAAERGELVEFDPRKK